MDWKEPVVRILQEQAENKDVCAVLESMSDEERLILDQCYIHRKQGAAERLADGMKLPLAEVFRHRDRALRHFAMAICEAAESECKADN